MKQTTPFYIAFIAWLRGIICYLVITMALLLLAPLFLLLRDTTDSAFHVVYGTLGWGWLIFLMSLFMAVVCGLPVLVLFSLFVFFYSRLNTSTNKIIILLTVTTTGALFTFIGTYIGALWYSDNNTIYVIDFTSVWKSFKEFLLFPVVGMCSAVIAIMSIRNRMYHTISYRASGLSSDILWI